LQAGGADRHQDLAYGRVLQHRIVPRPWFRRGRAWARALAVGDMQRPELEVVPPTGSGCFGYATARSVPGAPGDLSSGVVVEFCEDDVDVFPVTLGELPHCFDPDRKLQPFELSVASDGH
jgi:hypothetical protein